MPEIKNNFTGGKMNKDLDERVVPDGQYRDAMNIQVSTSEGSHAGTVQNILGNKPINFTSSYIIPSDAVCVGAISDESNGRLFSFITSDEKDLIIEYDAYGTISSGLRLIFNDINKDVLKFNWKKKITGINIIDDMLFWTDGNNEPKKINIDRCFAGTTQNGTNHTKLINTTTGITIASNIDIKEEDITIIKKSPRTALSLSFDTGRDPNLNYTGVVIVTPDPENNFNYSSFGGTPLPNGDKYDFSNLGAGDIMYLTIETDFDGNNDFSLDWIVGDDIVLYEFNEDGIPPIIPLTDYRIKGKITDWTYNAGHSANSFTQDSGVVGWNASNIYVEPINQAAGAADSLIGQAVVAIKIVAVSGHPPTADVGDFIPVQKYVIDRWDEVENLFEFKFPRFSYRYKYEDGEYSCYAPWSEIAFSPGAFDHHPKKGFNLGMTNRIIQLTVENFVPNDIPKDVVEVDILYKEDNSPNVYVVETVSPKDNPLPAQSTNTWVDNSYLIKSETIKASLPSNQLIRPFDNIPLKALAQDVTGNRIVYANYEQNFDLNHHRNGNKYYPDFTCSVIQSQVSSYTPVKSIKSLREYQLGVVFVDQYGRETPVISSPAGTLKLSKDYSDTGNTISVDFGSDGYPNHLKYFKFFIKETSGEYYNMAMDRYYDAEDGNIWLAFPSADRNKIDIDTFLILKKGTETKELVEEPARYKVLAIENEAPDYIKLSKLLIAERTHLTTGALGSARHIFSTTSMENCPEVGNSEFELNYQHFAVSSGGELHKVVKELGVDLYVEFGSVTQKERSRRYRVSEITCDYDSTQTQAGGSVIPLGNAKYYVKIENQFESDVNFITDDSTGVASTEIIDGAVVRFYKYQVENKPKFDGRFFVKIFNDGVFKRYIKKIFDIQTAEYRVTASKDCYFLSRDLHLQTFALKSINTFGTGNSSNTYSYRQYFNQPAGIPWNPVFTNTYLGEVHNATDWYGADILLGNAIQLTYTAGANQVVPHQGENARAVSSPTTVPNPGSGDINAGFWRKSHFHAWFNDFHWNQNFSPNPGGYANRGWISIFDYNNYTGYSHMAPSSNVYQNNVRDYNLSDPLPRETWFIDNGQYSAYVYGSNDMDWSIKRGSWYTNGLAGKYRHQLWNAGEDYTRIDLGFGGIYSHGTNGWSNNVNTVVSNFFAIGDPSHPEYNHHEDFVSKIVPGARFRFKQDPNQTIYTVQGGVDEDQRIRYYSGFESQGQQQLSNIPSSDDLKQDPEAMNSANYTKNWIFNVKPKLQWNPFGEGDWTGTAPTLGPIPNDKGHKIAIKTSNVSIPQDPTSPIQSQLGNWCIFLDTLRAGDQNHGMETRQIYPGMIVTGYNSSVELLSTAGYGGGSGNYQTMPNQYLLVHDIEYDTINEYYKVFLCGYEGPINRDDLTSTHNDVPGQHASHPAFAGDSYVLFEQPVVNGLSPAYCDNWNQMGPTSQGNKEDIYVAPVGYTLEWVEAIDPLEVLPENPAVWETEPKDTSVDLDIYYEASGYIPIMNWGYGELKTLIPLGSKIINESSNSITTFPHTIIGYGGDESAGTLVGITTTETNTEPLYLGLSQDTLTIQKPDNSIIKIKCTGVIDDGTNYILNLNGSVYQNATFELDWFNCYSFGNGVESNRIRDNFNLPFISNGVKVSTTASEQYQREHRKYGLIFSGIYNSKTGLNNLNQFVAAEGITKDVNPIYGSIQKLHSRDTDLVALCEDKILKILANKDAVYNADDNPNLVASPNVLGQTIPFNGEYGISTNPESFASEAYRVYFSDKVRGAIMRLSRDGLTPISNYGMKDWFRDNLKFNALGNDNLPDQQIIGSYDDRQDEYNLTIKSPTALTGTRSIMIGIQVVGPGEFVGWESQTLSFREDVKGWVSFKSFADMEFGISLENDYFTFNEGILWKHHVEDVDRNLFYNDHTPSSFEVLLNKSPEVVKNFKTLNYEGSQSYVKEHIEYTIDGVTYNEPDHYNLQPKKGWYVDNIVTDLQDGSIPEFIDKENKWFNYIRGTDINTNAHGQVSSVLDPSEFSFQGLGSVSGAGEVAILGCTDPNFVEYNPLATVDDGSCATAHLPGCLTHTSAINHDCATAIHPNAVTPCQDGVTIDDGSCKVVGCTDNSTFVSNSITYNTMFNYDPPPANTPCNDINNVPNGTGGGCCIETILGCTTPQSTNYDPLANTDDGSCIPIVNGCQENTASNYNSSANTEDCSCYWEGCTDATAFNPTVFNTSYIQSYANGCNVTAASITIDDGSCCYQQGCMATGMANFDAANCEPCVDVNGVSNGTAFTNGTSFDASVDCCNPCVYGCMIVGDPNYNALATCDDGTSCAIYTGCTNPIACNYEPLAIFDDGSCIIPTCCSDPLYINYDPNCSLTCNANATACGALVVFGCMTGTTTIGSQVNSNYNPLANVQQVSWADPTDPCTPCIYGCDDNTAHNYDPFSIYGPSATCNDGSCCYIAGCTNQVATNYDPTACYDDGSCILPITGCLELDMGPSGTAFNSQTFPGGIAVNSCEECIHPDINGNDIFYDYVNNVGNSCPSVIVDINTGQITGGCFDANGDPIGWKYKNYNPQATASCGGITNSLSGFSCCDELEGCKDISMYNYCDYCHPGNPLATSSCVPIIDGCLYSYFEDDQGNVFFNYNIGSGLYNHDPGTQGFSQIPVTATGNPDFDINTHNQNACVPINDPIPLQPGSPNSTTINLGDESSGCRADSSGNWPTNGQSKYAGYVLSTLTTGNPPSTNVIPGGVGYQVGGPYGWGTPLDIPLYDSVNALVNNIGGSTSGNVEAYNKNWDGFDGPGGNFGLGTSYPHTTNFFVTAMHEYIQWGSFAGAWHPSNMNACCNMSGCIHPLANNFDLIGYVKNRLDPWNPHYVGHPGELTNAGPGANTYPFFPGREGQACSTCPTGDPGEPDWDGGAASIVGQGSSPGIGADIFFEPPPVYDDQGNNIGGSGLPIDPNGPRWDPYQPAYTLTVGGGNVSIDPEGLWRCCDFGEVGCTDPAACDAWVSPTVSRVHGFSESHTWPGSCCYPTPNGGCGHCQTISTTAQGAGA